MSKQPWQNRITGYGDEAPDQLLANPKNWRVHPRHQQDALGGVLREVGIVQNVIVNRRTGFVVDGHMRVALALRDEQPSIPVTYVDLSDAEEALVLATLDPIGALAVTDPAKLDDLLRDVTTGEAAVQELLASLQGRAGGEPIDPAELWKGMPEFEQDDRMGLLLTVHFPTEADRGEFFERLGLSYTEKTKSVWYPRRPYDLNDHLGSNLIYSYES